MTVGSTSRMTCQRKKAISSDCLLAVYFSLPHQTESGSYSRRVIYTTQQCSLHRSFCKGKWWATPVTDTFHSNIRIIWWFKEEGKGECLGSAWQANKREERLYCRHYVFCDAGNKPWSSFWGKRRKPHWYWREWVTVSCFCWALWKGEWWHGKNMVFRGRAGLEYQLCYFLGWQAILPLYSPVFLVVKSDFNNFHSESCSVVSNSLRPHELYSPWNSPGQNTRVGSLSLLQESSWPRNRTRVSCTAGRFFTN